MSLDIIKKKLLVHHCTAVIFSLKYLFSNFHLDHVSIRLKPVHKVEGMTNGTAAGTGQQQQQQQGSGHVDISTQVQQYQQFLGEFSEQRATT